MLGDIDYSKKYEYNLVICKPNKEQLAELREVEDIQFSFRFPTTDELSFKVPKYIMYRHEKVKNPNFDLIKGGYRILLNNEKYFIMENPEEVIGDEDSITVNCKSLEYELTTRFAIGISGTFKLYDITTPSNGILNYLTSETTWTIGTIESELLLKSRTFDVDRKSWAELINDIQEQFGCVFIYNTLVKTIDIKSVANCGSNRGLFISKDNYLKTVNKEIKTDEIVTRLCVYGKDNITINSINPTGKIYIENFNYYRNTTYMSQSLLTALDSYDVLIDNNKTVFQGYLTQLTNLQTEKTVKDNELFVLKEELAEIQDQIDIANKMKEDLTLLNQQKELKQTEVNSKQYEVDSIQSDIDTVNGSISTLKNLLKKENNFTSEQLLELDNFIHEDEIRLDLYDDSMLQELYDEGVKVLDNKSQPIIDISIDSVDFLSMVKGQHDWDLLKLGDIVTIEIDTDSLVEFRLVGYTHNQDSQSLSLNFSNKNSLDNPSISFRDILSKLSSTTNSTNTKVLNISDYNKLTPIEKQQLLKEWNQIVAEKPIIEAQALIYSITDKKEDFCIAYNTLKLFIEPLLTDLTTTSNVSRDTLNSNLSSYYSKKYILQKKITDMSAFHTTLKADTNIYDDDELCMQLANKNTDTGKYTIAAQAVEVTEDLTIAKSLTLNGRNLSDVSAYQSKLEGGGIYVEVDEDNGVDDYTWTQLVKNHIDYNVNGLDIDRLKVASLQYAIDQIPNVNDHTAIILRCNTDINADESNEYAWSIQGFSGAGEIWVDFNGKTANGRFRIQDNAQKIKFTNSSTTTNAKVVMNRANQFDIFDILRCISVYFQTSGTQKGIDLYGNGTTSGSTIGIYAHSTVHVEVDCTSFSIQNAYTFMQITYGSTGIVKNIPITGAVGGKVYYAYHAGKIVSLATKHPTGTLSTASDISEIYIATSTTDATTPTVDTPTRTTKTVTISSNDSGQYRSNGGWNATGTEDVIQGSYGGSGAYRGLWLFNTSTLASTLASLSSGGKSPTVTKVRLYLTRKSSGGSSSAGRAYIRSHDYSSIPTGVPTLSSNSDRYKNATFRWGESKWVDVSSISSFKTGILNDTVKGFGLYVDNGDSSPYMRFKGVAKLEITYTYNV